MFACGFFATVCLALPRITANDPAKSTEILGYVAALMTVAFSASPLSAAAHVLRTGSVASMPIGLVAMTFLVTGQWWVIGNLIEDGFVRFVNYFEFCDYTVCRSCGFHECFVT